MNIYNLPDEIIQTIVLNIIKSNTKLYKELKIKTINKILINYDYDDLHFQVYDLITKIFKSINNDINSFINVNKKYNKLINSDEFWISLLKIQYPWFKIYTTKSINFRNLAIELNYISIYYDITNNFEEKRINILENIIYNIKFINTLALKYKFNLDDKKINMFSYNLSENLIALLSYIMSDINYINNVKIKEYNLLDIIICIIVSYDPNMDLRIFIDFYDNYINLYRIILNNKGTSDEVYKIQNKNEFIIKIFNYGFIEFIDDIIPTEHIPQVHGIMGYNNLIDILPKDKYIKWSKVYVKFLKDYNISYDDMIGIRNNLSVEIIEIFSSIEGLNIEKLFLNKILKLYEFDLNNIHYSKIFNIFLSNIDKPTSNNNNITIEYLIRLIKNNDLYEFIKNIIYCHSTIDLNILADEIIKTLNTDKFSINMCSIILYYYKLNNKVYNTNIMDTFLLKLMLNSNNEYFLKSIDNYIHKNESITNKTLKNYINKYGNEMRYMVSFMLTIDNYLLENLYYNLYNLYYQYLDLFANNYNVYFKHKNYKHITAIKHILHMMKLSACILAKNLGNKIYYNITYEIHNWWMHISNYDDILDFLQTKKIYLDRVDNIFYDKLNNIEIYNEIIKILYDNNDNDINEKYIEMEEKMYNKIYKNKFNNFYF